MYQQSTSLVFDRAQPIPTGEWGAFIAPQKDEMVQEEGRAEMHPHLLAHATHMKFWIKN